MNFHPKFKKLKTRFFESIEGSEEKKSSKTWYWVTLVLIVDITIAVFTISEDNQLLNSVRSLLGVILVLFLPGFAFVKALFPDNYSKPSEKNIDFYERAALSVGMSLVIVPVTVLVLNSTPWGVTLIPLTLSLLAITLLFATIAVIREF